jgi:FlaA1/EpsC-like NDP-sugar epimerase
VKEFFLVLFFVALGTLLTVNNLGQQLKLIAFLLVTSIILKPIIIFGVRKVFKYNNRISFLVSAVLAQISEFSLILAMAGVAQGSLSADFMTGAVVATLLSMMLTAYVIKFDEQLYTFFKPLLAPFEHLFGLRGKDHHHAHEAAKPEVVIIGVNSMSAETVELLAHNKSLLVIEKNPKKLHSYQERGIHTICSDVFNTDLYDELIDFTSVKSVASVMGDFSANAFLIRKLRSVNKKAALIVTARTEDQGRKLYKQGATLVLVPDVTGRRILADALSGDAHIHDVGQAYEQELNKSFVYFRA